MYLLLSLFLNLHLHPWSHSRCKGGFLSPKGGFLGPLMATSPLEEDRYGVARLGMWRGVWGKD